MTIARTMFTIMPEVMVLSMKPKVFSIERIIANDNYIKRKLLEFSFC